MKDKFKKIIPVFISIYCLIVIPIILYKYSIYLNKPNNYTWDQIKEYLISSGEYNNEPIVFNPGWLKNYATDYGRFQKFNIAKTNNSFRAYRLISINKEKVKDNYKIIIDRQINNLSVVKLKIK